MRYITHISNLVLYNRGGETPYRFGIHGELVVGNPTLNTAGNILDTTAHTDVDLDLQAPWDLDLAGTAAALGSATYIERVGRTFATSTSPRSFIEAPPLAAGTATVPAVAGIDYEVLAGTMTYNGVTYTVGQRFTTDGTTTATVAVTATATFALAIPLAWLGRASDFASEEFRIKTLIDATDMRGYWNPSIGGFIPSTNLNSTDPAYFGRID